MMRYTCLVLVLLTPLIGCDPNTRDEPIPPPEDKAKISFVYHGLFIDEQGEIVDNPSKAELTEFWRRYRARDVARRAQEKIEREAFLDAPETAEPVAPVRDTEPPSIEISNPAPTPLPAPPAVPVTASAYVKDCDQKDVPIPPPWGDPGWRKQTDLPSKLVAASQPGYRTEIWTYENTNGICVALPRIDISPPPPDEVQLLGIICQSRVTEYACFWDNIDRTTGTRITGAAMTGKGPSDLQDGNSLGENCTNCHRGDNVFNVYPGTDLELNPRGTDAGGTTRYKPVASRPTWVNPAGTLALPNCTMCHDLPALTLDYCRTILKKSLGPTPTGQTAPPPTMPPPPDKWDDPGFKADVKTLQEACFRLDATGADPGVDFGLGIPRP